MKIKKSHKQRADSVKEFLNKNKLFSIMILVALIYLVFGLVNSIDSEKSVTSESTYSQSETLDENESDSDENSWRFYWIDLWVLVIAGGFCTIMIIRERRKAREKLQ